MKLITKTIGQFKLQLEIKAYLKNRMAVEILAGAGLQPQAQWPKQPRAELDNIDLENFSNWAKSYSTGEAQGLVNEQTDAQNRVDPGYHN